MTTASTTAIVMIPEGGGVATKSGHDYGFNDSDSDDS